MGNALHAVLGELALDNGSERILDKVRGDLAARGDDANATELVRQNLTDGPLASASVSRAAGLLKL